MSKKSKGIILLLVFLIVAIIIFLCCNYAKGFNVVQTSNTTNYINESVSNTIENKVENNIDNNIDVTKVVEEHSVEEEPAQEPEPVKEPDENIDNVQNEDSELQSNNDEEKAIAIVKKDWGSTTGVAFKVEQINGDGSYIISVRNEDSVAMAWYTVYPKTGKFTK